MNQTLIIVPTYNERENLPRMVAALLSLPVRVDVLVVVPACPLDHQTAGLVARVVEEAGIATVTVSTGRDITASVRPPRSVFVNFPMGNAFGCPFDVKQQRAILRDALTLLERNEPGVLVDLPYDWGTDFKPMFKDRGREFQLQK